MESRGRRSTAELSVVRPSGGLVAIEARPEAPVELTREQATEWTEIVNRLPAEWFPRETHGMLAQYCRHVINARRVAKLIETLANNTIIDVEEYDRLLKMQEREGRAISSLATRMRISQQSTLSQQKRKPAMTLPKPWEK